ncbi:MULTISPECIES: siderophore-interacting protein [Streptomycetaceae]|uniref:siderophore-interacting protein n=1 Tax=Embleya scabrispora TaxID=159449 RepID=UPI000374ED83|nr:SIP domain-containing protein [Streptomyces sp. SID5474]
MLPKVQLPQTRRMISLTVRQNTRLSPNFVRLTLGGPELEHLHETGFDQGVRLFFPREGQQDLRMPKVSNNAWVAELMLLPKARRPWVRNYTVRAFRPERHEIDIEFALHGDAGPASAWAARARPGDPAGIFDLGRMYLPPSHVDWHLLVGDESALPAILSILEHAPASLVAEVFLEVPEVADIRERVEAPAGVRVHWTARNGAGSRPGRLALNAVESAALPAGPFYTWTAGEHGLPTGLRRHLVNERKVPKSDITFFGYWRHGRSSPG